MSADMPDPDVPDSRAGGPQQGKKSNAFFIAIVIVGVLFGGCFLLGLISALAAPAFMRYRQKAEEQQVRDQLVAMRAVAQRDPEQAERIFAAPPTGDRRWIFRIERGAAGKFVIVATPPADSRSK